MDLRHNCYISRGQETKDCTGDVTTILVCNQVNHHQDTCWSMFRNICRVMSVTRYTDTIDTYQCRGGHMSVVVFFQVFFRLFSRRGKLLVLLLCPTNQIIGVHPKPIFLFLEHWVRKGHSFHTKCFCSVQSVQKKSLLIFLYWFWCI